MKFIKLITLITGIMASAASFAGDIYEILPCNQFGDTLTAPVSSIEAPLTTGDTIYFKIRVPVVTKDWNYRYLGTGTTVDEIVDELVYPLGIGIYVSGEVRFAKYVTCKDPNATVRDFIFSYTTRPGDFALPIRLALDNYTPATGDNTTSGNYLIQNGDKFNIALADKTVAQFSYGSPGVPVTKPEGGARVMDYSLEKAGFYIKSIDFDSTFEDGDIWRSVHSGSTITGSGMPRLVADSAPSNSVTLYVWSEDDSIVKVKGGTPTTMIKEYVGGVPQTASYTVGKVVFSAGKIDANFTLEGVGDETSPTTNLILSDFNAYHFNSANVKITDYISAKVKASEALPPTLVIEPDKTLAYAEGKDAGEPYSSAAQLSVYMSQPYPNPLTVTVTPRFEDGTADSEMEKYVRFSKTSPTISALPAFGPVTFTIPANSITKVPIFLYALRADEHTMNEGHRILFDLSIADATDDAAISKQNGGVLISAYKPQIITPTAETEISATSGDEVSLTVSVRDTYADETDTTTGYIIYFKADDTQTLKPISSNGTDPDYFVIHDGELVLKGDPDHTRPKVTWNSSGDHKPQIQVKSPINGKTSEIVTFKANIAPARTIHIDTTDTDKADIYNEGDIVNVAINLSTSNDSGNELYAFILPSSNAPLKMFMQNGSTRCIIDTDPANTSTDKGATEGIEIGKNVCGPGDPVTTSFVLQDGGDPKMGGLEIAFKVVLCSSRSYDESKVLKNYHTITKKIKSFNVVPVISDVEFKNISISEFDNHVYPYAIPNNQPVRIQPIIDDVAFDFGNPTQPMKYKYTASLISEGNFEPVSDIVTADADAVDSVPHFEYNFPVPGTWKIKIQAWDKDMGSNCPTKAALDKLDPGAAAASIYEFTVRVLDQPGTLIELPEDGFLNENQNSASIKVGLDWYGATGSGNFIAVKVTVEPPASGDNPGTLKFSDTYKKGRGVYPDLPVDSNEYYLFFTAAGQKTMSISELDGTDKSSGAGFLIKAEVIGDQHGTTGTHPTVRRPDDTPMPWSEYYQFDATRLRIENVAPICDMTQGNTNAWNVAGGAASSYPITVRVTKDIQADFTGIPSCPGIKVSIIGCNGGTLTPTNPTWDPAKLEFYVTDNTPYKFIPDFGSEQGEKIVTVVVEDKDSGAVRETYMYNVKASKFLVTVPNGPGKVGTTLSDRYAGAAGTGMGHVFVTGQTQDPEFTNYQVRWNCSEAVTVNVLAWGYKVGDVDDGSLNGGQDIPISPTGNNVGAGGPYYTYGDLSRDSFLYGWIRHGVEKESSKVNTELVAISIENPNRGAAITPIVLPETHSKDETGPYAETFAEAIFSKEYRPLDNLGDINQDGIPDFYVRKYGLGVYDTKTGELLGDGDDLKDVSAYNDDVDDKGAIVSDYLPNRQVMGGGIIPHISEWSTDGEPFTAYLEIRGFEPGLNAGYLNADGSAPDPDYGVNEKRAYLLWKGIKTAEELLEMEDDTVVTEFEAHIDDAREDLKIANSGIAGANNGDVDKGWSPERPTDPTLADTDHDGLEDGYEYWFWYMAKVGFTDKDGKWMPPVNVGQRVNLTDMDKYGYRHFEPIPAVEVVNAFDPQVNGAGSGGNASTRGNLLERDFDGDGLYDIEEYLIGSSPIDCDTDGDGTPDGFEVMWGFNPIDAADGGAGSNPDGDAMAWAAVEEGEIREYVTDRFHGATKHVLVLVRPDAKCRTDEFVCSVIAEKDDDGIPFATGVDGEGNTYFLTDEDEGYDPATQYAAFYNFCGDKIPRVCRRFVTVNNSIESDRVDTYEGCSLNLVHDQVYNYFGFDPRTGWCAAPCEHGCVSGRWCPKCNTKNPKATYCGEAGMCINTRGFTTRDEYALAQYFYWNGKYNTPEKDSVFNILLANCTNPNIAFEDKEFPNVEAYGGEKIKLTSTQHGADTDGDGVADGWTLYCGGNPCCGGEWGKDKGSGGFGGEDKDEDDLTAAAEFAGLDVVNAYASCPSIYSNNLNSVWLNKFFPTDPYSEDTDKDGVNDGLEGCGWVAGFKAGRLNGQERQSWDSVFFTFLYAKISYADDDGTSLCFRGGGTNPCSSDTDLDGLPDAWERQFAGVVADAEGNVADFSDIKDGDFEKRNNTIIIGEIRNPQELYTEALKIADGVGLTSEGDGQEGSGYKFAPVGRYIFGGMDATDADDAFTRLEVDKQVGTIRDRDFDRDGLENFQEYLTQSVRAWRYDDGETPLMGRCRTWADGSDQGDLTISDRITNFPTMDIISGADYFNNVIAAYGANFTTGNDFANNYLTKVGGFEYDKIGYMAPCENTWDPMYQAGIANMTMYGQGFHYMRPPSPLISYTEDVDEFGDTVYLTKRAQGFAYVSTDPRTWDSDEDGMDDYWEIFHGLNPLLGTRDLVSEGTGFSADINAWVEDYLNPAYDPMRAPWRMGLPMADPDGDGLRNIDEAIMGNMTSPSTYHTDPSPLWMTDKSSSLSYVSQSYTVKQNDDPASPGYSELNAYPWMWAVDTRIGSSSGADYHYIFSFEETEGYDTDGDWVGDGHEVVHNITPASDPLNSMDPDRRAALYLDGIDSLLYSKIESNIPFVSGYGAYDMFRQFTVEAWVKPEDKKVQTIIERGFTYPASNLTNNEPQYRANFRMSLDEENHVCAMFDNDNAVVTGSDGFGSQKLVSDVDIPMNDWTHVAMSFDGKKLCLYINGRLVKSAYTSLIPANGIVAILQEPSAVVYDKKWETILPSTKYPMSSYETCPGANIIGARRTATNFAHGGDFTQFGDYFNGYIAEVRVWDGPRTEDEIRANYKVRFSYDDLKDNREKVFSSWAYDEATRNNNDGKPNLPAELMMYYNFQQLAAAVEPGDVAKIPSGFDLGVIENSGADSNEILIKWWNDEWSQLKSKVYTDGHIVPWVHNSVSRLPLLDGSFTDSMFWGEKLAGYYSDSQKAHGLSDYAIPNGANPYKSRSYRSERDIRYWRLIRLYEAEPSLTDKMTDIIRRYAFEISRQFVGQDDLLPLGHAFAKVDDKYWDENGAATMWTDTGADGDGDGLPDWWEALQGSDLKPNDEIPYGGVKMTAAEAYMRDIAKGMLPDGTIHSEYKDKSDTDGDGLVDWWQKIYNVTGGAMGDDDGDGLSNYIEYLLTEVFNVGTFDPDNAYSLNPKVSDYFFKVGESYVGEIFTDHDFIDDAWEDKWSNQAATRYVYDADKDSDGDGWSNYAEFQAGTDPTAVGSLGIDSVQMKEFPVPTIDATIIYEGTQQTFGHPIIVKAWRDSTLQSRPDAKWTIGGGKEVSYVGGNEGTETLNFTGVKYLGLNSGKNVSFHLTPGSVQAGSVQIQFHDPARIEVNNQTGSALFMDDTLWFEFVKDRQIGSSSRGELFVKASDDDDDDKSNNLDDINSLTKVVGSIDYTTGKAEIDLSKLPEFGYLLTAGPGGQNDGNGGSWTAIYTFANCYIRTRWNSQPIAGGIETTYYLSDADQLSQNSNAGDHVREGRNTFIAFYDLDDDGKFTPGEPYGVAPNVMVGWNGAKTTIELTDTSVVTARFQVGAESGEGSGESESGEALNDRDVLMPSQSGNASIINLPTVTPGGTYARIRVVRTHVNEKKLLGNSAAQGIQKVPAYVVLDKLVDLKNEPYITEADFLRDGELDIDWKYLANDLEQLGGSNIMMGKITNVTYRVLVGDDQDIYSESNRFLAVSFNRRFDDPTHYGYATPVCLGGGVEVTSASPTFSWAIPFNKNTYTAFKIKIEETDGTLVWDSDYQPMPPSVLDNTITTNSNRRYDWKAPIFAGSVIAKSGKLFENNKTYRWKMKVSNALYKNIDTKWSEYAYFRMNVLTNVADMAVANVAVRYYGPANVTADATAPIRVQAFTTADFSGTPVAEGYVKDRSKIAETADVSTANATLIGLEKGTYYMRAFIDQNKNGIHDDWESWGYVCQRDKKKAKIYTPEPIIIGGSIGNSEILKIFIEDCDTDQDNLPDAWEWACNGNLTTFTVKDLDEPLDGILVAVKKSLTDNLTVGGSPVLTSGMTVMLKSALSSPYRAAMVLGADMTGINTPDGAQLAVDSLVTDTTSVEPKSINVTGITIDPDGTIKIDVTTTAELESAIPSSVNAIYQFKTASSVKVDLELWEASDLQSPDWKLVKTEELEFSGDAEDVRTISPTTKATGGKGFYKVILKEKK